ncbi:hypothetical protein [Zhihengliuella halotolerans]|uniref:hypothetical protein n=1 Tax=Zhihengliuella halotolerans TaxID=370736 RepID=UPI000C80CA78|nr:hypothetical protein [Zhihengliuella halotolerans]
MTTKTPTANATTYTTAADAQAAIIAAVEARSTCPLVESWYDVPLIFEEAFAFDAERQAFVQTVTEAEFWTLVQHYAVGHWDGWKSATLRSTTGTAPIHFARTDDPETFRIDLEDGSSQVYGRTEILAALLSSGVLLPSPWITATDMVRLALALELPPSEMFAGIHGKQK